jgi:hypothetical protein
MEDEDGNYENKEEANKALKTITEIDEDGEEYSYEVVNYDYLFENRKDKLNTYKHTFRKGNDGNYYWYSTELVNNN